MRKRVRHTPGLCGMGRCRHRTNASPNACSIRSANSTRIGTASSFVSLTVFATTGALPAVQRYPRTHVSQVDIRVLLSHHEHAYIRDVTCVVECLLKIKRQLLTIVRCLTSQVYEQLHATTTIRSKQTHYRRYRTSGQHNSSHDTHYHASTNTQVCVR